MKQTAGKIFGDKKLETEGKTDKAAGKVQNAVEGGPYVSVGHGQAAQK